VPAHEGAPGAVGYAGTVRSLGSAAVWTVAASIVIASPGRAQERALAVTADGCEGLDVHHLEELLRLELGDVVRAAPAQAPLATARVVCERDAILLSIEDALTGKRVARAIAGPVAREQGRERVLALAIAQLFDASWLELLTRPEAHEARTPRSIPAARAAARTRVARRVAIPSARVTGTRIDAAIAVGVRARDLAHPFVSLSAAPRITLWLDRRWGALAEAGIELGTASRQSGDVAMRAARLGGGIALRSSDTAPLRVDARALVLGVLMELDGAPRLDGIIGDSASSVALDAVVAGAVRGQIDWLEIALELEAGSTFHAPRGLVRAEPDVSPSGPWIGAGLRAGVTR